MTCKWWDCGWCYAPRNLETNSNDGICMGQVECAQAAMPRPAPDLPPINLNNSLSADNFYRDNTYNSISYPEDEAPPNGMKQRDRYDADDPHS